MGDQVLLGFDFSSGLESQLDCGLFCALESLIVLTSFWLTVENLVTGFIGAKAFRDELRLCWILATNAADVVGGKTSDPDPPEIFWWSAALHRKALERSSSFSPGVYQRMAAWLFSLFLSCCV